MIKNKFMLCDVDVVKCVFKGVMYLDFFFDEFMFFVVLGDKEGYIGLWRVDKTTSEEEDEDDGVLYYKVYGLYILYCKWGCGVL